MWTVPRLVSEPLGWNHFDNLISGDGGELTFGSAAVYTNGTSPSDVLDRLHANGWEVSEPTTRYDRPLILAQRGSDIIELEQGNINLIRDTPWAVYPVSIVAILLGMALSWIVFGWASRRTEHQQGALMKFLFGLTLFFWCAPLISAPALFTHHLNERHIRWHPLWEFLGQPTFSLLFLAGCVTSMMCLALAAGQRAEAPAIGETTLILSDSKCGSGKEPRRIPVAPVRHDRRPDHHHAHQLASLPRQAIRPRDDVRRRRTGHGYGHRKNVIGTF